MMLSFSVVPQTLLVKGFQPTVNQTEKPSPQTPTPINHPLTADTFTPSAVKSRAGGELQEQALEAFKQAFEKAGFPEHIKSETHSARQDIANFVYGKPIDGDLLEWIDHLKNIPNISEKLKSAVLELEEALLYQFKD